MNKISQLFFGAGLIILSGCASNIPSQEMSDARQLTQAALDAGAGKYFPLLMRQIADQIVNAEQQLAFGDYPEARQQALIVKSEAARARSMTLILIATNEIVTRAERIARPMSPNPRLILEQAQNAAQNGDEAAALVLAAQARHEAERALDDYYLNLPNSKYSP